MIIAIEGADGAGKATQTTLLAENLGGTRFAFPNYDSPTGKAILGHLKKEWAAAWYDCGSNIPDIEMVEASKTSTLDALVFQCLQVINRLELLPQINEALAKGPVVFDRYSASGLVYGGLDGLDREWLERVNASLPQPDLWIYLDIPIEESFKRRPDRRDRIESDRPYLEKVRLEYLKLFAEKQTAHLESWGSEGSVHDANDVVEGLLTRAQRSNASWVIVDGLGTVEEVHERIMDVVGNMKT